MKFILVTLVIIGSSLRTPSNASVIIKFDKIEEYGYQIISSDLYSRGLIDSITQSAEERYKLMHITTDYCHKLRQSKFFEIGDKSTRAEKNFSDNTYVMDRRLLDVEKNFIEQLKQEEELSFIRGENPILSFPCYDLNGQLKWGIGVDRTYFSNFLFEIDEETESEKLISFIDFEGEILTSKVHDKELLFLESVHHRDPKVGEPLCSLHRYLQLRLCSIAADAIRQSIPRVKPQSGTRHLDILVYEDPFSNFHYPEESANENCPIMTVTMEGHASNTKKVESRLLKCDVDMKNQTFKFYLSRNMLKTIDEFSVFVITEKKKVEKKKVEKNTSKFVIRSRMNIELLKNIKLLDRLFKEIEGKTSRSNGHEMSTDDSGSGGDGLSFLRNSSAPSRRSSDVVMRELSEIPRVLHTLRKILHHCCIRGFSTDSETPNN